MLCYCGHYGVVRDAGQPLVTMMAAIDGQSSVTLAQSPAHRGQHVHRRQMTSLLWRPHNVNQPPSGGTTRFVSACRPIIIEVCMGVCVCVGGGGVVAVRA